MDISELSAGEEEVWDEYVQQAAGASFWHLAGWKTVMERTFGHQTVYLNAQENGRVVGLLPLLYVKSTLAGHYLTSVPGGLCADSEAVAAGLIEQAQELTRVRNADYLILRDSPTRWDLPGFVITNEHCDAIVHLPDTVDQTWKLVGHDEKRHTRKAAKAGLAAAISQNGLDSYYPVYLEAMRDIGTPTPGRKFFCNVADRFPDSFKIITVHQNGLTVGGGTLALFKDTLFCLWSGMLRRYYPLHPSHALYWEALKYSCQHGLRQVNLGRCQRDSGAYKFKLHWGAEARPLYQHYYLRTIDQPPPVGASMKEEARYRLFVNVWRHLPLAATEAIGPHLRKRMPFG
ncbi:MAG: GNAT family N-acetyltransferase [Chloroflexota bacterium]